MLDDLIDPVAGVRKLQRGEHGVAQCIVGRSSPALPAGAFDQGLYDFRPEQAAVGVSPGPLGGVVKYCVSEGGVVSPDLGDLVPALDKLIVDFDRRRGDFLEVVKHPGH